MHGVTPALVSTYKSDCRVTDPERHWFLVRIPKQDNHSFNVEALFLRSPVGFSRSFVVCADGVIETIPFLDLSCTSRVFAKLVYIDHLFVHPMFDGVSCSSLRNFSLQRQSVTCSSDRVAWLLHNNLLYRRLRSCDVSALTDFAHHCKRATVCQGPRGSTRCLFAPSIRRSFVTVSLADGDST